jgi:hypothetical protein
LKIFDDVNGEIRKLKRDIRTVESTQSEVSSLETHVNAMRAAREKKKSNGQSLTKEQEAMLASEEEKLTNHRYTFMICCTRSSIISCHHIMWLLCYNNELGRVQLIYVDNLTNVFVDVLKVDMIH